jgi:hypothetical protein
MFAMNRHLYFLFKFLWIEEFFIVYDINLDFHRCDLLPCMCSKALLSPLTLRHCRYLLRATVRENTVITGYAIQSPGLNSSCVMDNRLLNFPEPHFKIVLKIRQGRIAKYLSFRQHITDAQHSLVYFLHVKCISWKSKRFDVDISLLLCTSFPTHPW